MISKDDIKKEIYKISAITDRGQRLNKLIAPVYEDKYCEIKRLVNELEPYSEEITEQALTGDWELIFSSVELFRSSPFFLAIEKAFNNQDKSNLFFKLHLLQVGSFGLSTIGRVYQKIDFNENKFQSTFDTTIFGLTVIPLIGWFKLLPTFGGRVITIADNMKLKNKIISMTLNKTMVTEIDGLKRIPLISKFVMDRWYPVNSIWKKLPWNKDEPNCEIYIVFIDKDLRISENKYGEFSIYIRKTFDQVIKNHNN